VFCVMIKLDLFYFVVWVLLYIYICCNFVVIGIFFPLVV
jgi:hypothetical protein